MAQFKYTLGLEEVLLSDIDKVGGKNASLGEMIQNLSPLGVKVPGGYAVTVAGYWKYLDYNDMRDRVKDAMDGLDTDDVVQLRQVGSKVRNIVRDGVFPEEMITEIRERYLKMSAEYGNEITDVAVRSSATAEDLPDASFAGQQETYLNVRGSESILNSVRDCFASLFTDRAISYRENFGYDHFNIGLSVTIQKMVRSDLGAAGVAFSLDTESGFKDVVLINGSYGLGEMVVGGAVKPDEFLVFKPTLAKGFRPIV
ncbi:MAG: phosphoenolpyruvate synthase, partial [Flavobacteriales bacterium]|nr:phosphoenolpyruvate synthase [Flavobacteriales bacterium]